MTAAIQGNELAKMRRLRIVPLAALMGVLMCGVVVYVAGSDPTARAWDAVLMGLVMGAVVCCPFLIAVLASRLVDVEHQGGGWLLSATAGADAGRLSRGKFVVLGTLVSLVIAGVSLVALALGTLLMGRDESIPLGRWAGVTLAVLVVTLALLAVHIVLAVAVENQLVGLGVGLLGMILALFAPGFPDWAQHLVPWGYYTLAVPAEYVGPTLTEVQPAYASVLGLGVVVGLVFALVTRRFDRQEA